MTKSTIDDYLKLPYTRVVVPEPETGGYSSEIVEFPGCVSQGDTPGEAYENLEDAARSWLQATLDAGRAIPEPFNVTDYSGKYLLRLPRSLHKQAAQVADLDATSLNQFFIAAIAEKVGREIATNACVSAVRELAAQRGSLVNVTATLHVYPNATTGSFANLPVGTWKGRTVNNARRIEAPLGSFGGRE